MILFNPNKGVVGLVFAAAISTVIFSGCTTLSGNKSPFVGESQPDTPGLIEFYQGPLNHLSAVRRGSCPMYPSCSKYAHQAMAKHGPIKGWVMATDRLLRCGRDESRLAPKVWVNGQVKFYDPVDQNDSWWVKSDDSEPFPEFIRTPDN